MLNPPSATSQRERKTDNRLSPQKKLSSNQFESLSQEEYAEDPLNDFASSSSSSSASVIDNTMVAAASLSIKSNTTDTFDIGSMLDFPRLTAKLTKDKSKEEHTLMKEATNADSIGNDGDDEETSTGDIADKSMHKEFFHIEQDN